MAWLDTWFDISNNYVSAWSNRVGQNRETGGEQDKNCVEEGFQLARVKFDRDGEGCSDAPGVGSCSSNIWDGSEQELAWFKKSSLYFEDIFIIWYFEYITF